jgi:hypothetical protein
VRVVTARSGGAERYVRERDRLELELRLGGGVVQVAWKVSVSVRQVASQWSR